MNYKTNLNKDELKKGLHLYEEESKIFKNYNFVGYLNFIILSLYLYFLSLILLNPILLFPLLIPFVIFISEKIYIKRKVRLDDFETLEKGKLEDLIKEVMEYFFKKGKRRDNKKIEFIIERVEKAETHFLKYKKLIKINKIMVIAVIYVEILIFGLFLLIFLRTNPSDLNIIILLILFVFVSSTYTIISLMVHNNHIINVERTKKLFELSISKEIDKITNKLERKAIFLPLTAFSDELKTDNLEKLVKNWFNKYLGDFRGDIEDNQLLYDYRDLIITREKEEYYFHLFNNLKAKIVVLTKHPNMNKNALKSSKDINKVSEKSKNATNENELIEMIDEIIKILNFNIDYKKSKKIESFERRNSIFIGFSAIVSLIALIATVFKP